MSVSLNTIAQIWKHIWLEAWMLSRVSPCGGFLWLLFLLTKCRCLCLCLILISEAQLSSAPLLTLFSQHSWYVLSTQHRNVHIQIHHPVIKKQSHDVITEMKARENIAPRWAARKMDFNLADCCHQGLRNDSEPWMLLLSRLSQLDHAEEFCGRR